MTKPVRVILGAGGVGSSDDPIAGHNTPEAAQAFLDIFRKHGYTEIDTGRGYPPHAPGTSEPILGQTDFSKWANLDTKVAPIAGYDHTAAGIAKSIEDSLSALRVDSVSIFYLHWPDRDTPLAETHKAIDDAYKAGKFKYFGISNYEADEVETLMQQSKEHGWIKPTVYQGQYNAVCRSAETAILPTLRKHGIAFYAWSPAAAGFFGKQFRHKSDTKLGDVVRSQYGNDAMAKTLKRLKDASEKEGVTPHAIAIRWLLFHSDLKGELDDGIVAGARSDEQLEDTLKACKEGPLPNEAVSLVNECWKELEPDAPYFSPFRPK